MAGPQGGGGARPPQGQGQAMQRQGQKSVLALLQEQKASFALLIPKHLNPDRLLRIAESSIKRNPKLLAADAISLLRAVAEAATLGLEPGVLGDGWLIPYGKEVQFQPGFQGLIRLATNSGAVKDINAGGVGKDDLFDYALGSEPYVKHRPSLDVVEDAANLIAAYAVVKTVQEGKQVTVMGKVSIDRIRARSKSSGSGPWVTDYWQMAIKTVLRRAMKYVPKTAALSQALEYDERRDLGQPTRDLFPDLETLGDGEAIDTTGGTVQPNPQGDTAESVAEKMRKQRAAGATPAQPAQQNDSEPPDDIQWETKEEEELRKAREANEKRAATSKKEPGSDG